MLVYCSEVKNPYAEHLDHDQPHRRAHADGREKQMQHAEHEGVGDQHRR